LAHFLQRLAIQPLADLDQVPALVVAQTEPTLIWFLRTQFSSAKYSFRVSSSWSTEPVI
jgi:hypothetical protein